MSESLIDLTSDSPKWKCSSTPLIPSNIGINHDCDGSNPFDLIACESAANTAAEDDPFEIVLRNSMQSKVCQTECAPAPPPISDGFVDDQKDSSLHLKADVLASLDDDELSKLCRRLTICNLDDIPAPEGLQTSLLDISDYLDVSFGSIETHCKRVLSTSARSPSLNDSDKCQGVSPSLFPITLSSKAHLESPKPFELLASNDMSRELKIEWAQKRISNIIQEAEMKSKDRSYLACLATPVRHAPQSLSLASPYTFQTMSSLNLDIFKNNTKKDENSLSYNLRAYKDPVSVLDSTSFSKKRELSVKSEESGEDKFNCAFTLEGSNSISTDEMDVSLAIENHNGTSNGNSGREGNLVCNPKIHNDPIFALKSTSVSRNIKTKVSSVDSVDTSQDRFNCAFVLEGSNSNSSCEVDLHPMSEEDHDDSVFLASVPHPDWNLPELSEEDLKHVKKSAKTIPLIYIEDDKGHCNSYKSPPALPPLPLCKDAVRELSLCSRFSPSRKQEFSVKGVKNSVQVCSKPGNSSASRLSLRKPMEKAKDSHKGPMKALLPVRDMTRKDSSKYVSPSPTTRKMPSSPSKRKPILETPVKRQYPNLTNASSLPQAVNRQIHNRPFTTSPARLTPSKALHATGQNTPNRLKVGQSISASPNRVDQRCARPVSRASNLQSPSVKSRPSLQVEPNSNLLKVPASNSQVKSNPSNIPGNRIASRKFSLYGGSKVTDNLNCSSAGKARILTDVNRQPLWKSPTQKVSRMPSPRPRSTLSVVPGKENIG